MLCLERRGVAGGGLATEEDPRHPGFLHNTHSFYHRALTHAPWYRDLQLERRGAVYIEPDFNVALILRNGETLEWWTDFERTAASFARFSARDEAALRRWRRDFLPIVDAILIPESRRPPLPREQRRQLLDKSAEGRLLLKVSEMSPLEFVLREFENPVVQAGLLFFNGLREVDLRCHGFGHHIPALLASPGKAQMCIGGSAALARALVSAVTESGGDIRLQTTPRRILVDRGRVTGVEASDGTRYEARHFVASGLNPQQTFLQLLDANVLPADWRDKAQAFQYNLLAPLFALHLNLSEPPQYAAAQKNASIEQAFMIILGLEHFKQFSDIVRCHEEGTIPPTVMWGSCPTIFDSSQAPAGKHTAFMWEKVPYQLNGDFRQWDVYKEEHGRVMLDLWSQYAPGLKGALLDAFVRTPLDTERTLPNMQDGDLLVGAFGHGQVGSNRPFEGAGQYRAHLGGLYLCGASCHPGGNITGLAGYNCAQVILNDLGSEVKGRPPIAQT